MLEICFICINIKYSPIIPDSGMVSWSTVEAAVTFGRAVLQPSPRLALIVPNDKRRPFLDALLH